MQTSSFSWRGLALACVWVCVAGVIAPAAALAADAKPAARSAKPSRVDFPRTRQGKPDFSGIWQTLSTAEWDLEPHPARKDAPAGLGVVVGGSIPYRPEALAQKEKNFAQRAELDPRGKCYMPGVPRATYTPLPFQILQNDQTLTLLYEYAHTVRTIYANGSKHPEGHIDWWMGDSRAHWEGDTLVVDVIHLIDQTWFDRAGNYHSEDLHVVERYTPTGPDHIRYEATIDDPKVYSKPWTISLTLYRIKEPNAQLLEYECYAFDFEKIYP